MSQLNKNSMCFILLGDIDKCLFFKLEGERLRFHIPSCHLNYPLQDHDWNISGDVEVCQPIFSFVPIPAVCLPQQYISLQAMSLFPGYISASVLTLLSVPPLYLSQPCFFSIHLCLLLNHSVPAIPLSLCSCSVPLCPIKSLSHLCHSLYPNKEKNCSNILNNTFFFLAINNI